MDLAVIVLAVLYLCGYNVGKALAICSLIEVFLMSLIQWLRKKQEKIEKNIKSLDK